MKVLFVDGTANHDPKARTDRPTGGILNSLTLVPEYLATQGHEVFVTSTYGKTEDVNGVHYIANQSDMPKWDLTVFNRDVLPRDMVLHCKEKGIKMVWWLHDIVQTTYLKDDAFRYMNKIVALSEYCKKTYSDFYSIDSNKFAVIPNGVDKDLFYPGEYESRDSNLMIMASALVKGYLPIPTLFDNLMRVHPDVDFRIYSNQSLHGQTNSKGQQGFLDAMERQGAHVYSPVSPKVLAHLLRKASCLLMPNSYPEICSNLLLQAQASGCPVVTSNIGSAAEFIENGKTGVMTTKYVPHDQYSWVVEYTDLVLGLQSNRELHQSISKQSVNGVLSWKQVGEKWNELLQHVME